MFRFILSETERGEWWPCFFALFSPLLGDSPGGEAQNCNVVRIFFVAKASSVGFPYKLGLRHLCYLFQRDYSQPHCTLVF